MDNKETFEAWLTRTQKQRDALFAYSKTPMPTDAGERTADIDKSLRAAEAAGEQCADAQYFLTQATAQAILTARDLSPDLLAKERDIMVKDSVKDIQRLYDYLDVLCKVLNSRVRAGCNARRSLL